jgi:hypothetical protein
MDIKEVRRALKKHEYPTERELIEVLCFVNHQQKEIDQLKEESIKLEKDCEKLMTEMLIETHNTIHLNLELESENTKLKEALKLI